MDFDITKVTIDGTVDDLSEDQLRNLVGKFRDAQESNVAEFEKAAKEMNEIDESDIADFEDVREALIGDITDAEAFDEVPLSEDSLEDAEFSELREWKAFVADESETSEEDEDADFDDMGNKTPSDPGEDEKDFVDEELSAIPGLKLD